MKRKILALTLVLVVICLCFTACAKADVEEIAYFDSGALRYALLKEVIQDYNDQIFYAKVVGYIGEESSVDNPVVTVTIPSTVIYEDKEYDVKMIGSLAFQQKKVTQIDVEEGIVGLDSFAFAYCDLSVMNLPSTIQTIGEYAFVGCNSMGTLNLLATTPPSVGAYAFMIYREDKNIYAVNAKVKIKVPSASLADYKNASIAPTWSVYTGILL